MCYVVLECASSVSCIMLQSHGVVILQCLHDKHMLCYTAHGAAAIHRTFVTKYRPTTYMSITCIVEYIGAIVLYCVNAPC